MNRGKLAVLSILALAVALAGFGLWWNVTGGQRTLEFWGREAGARIIDPEAKVELLWLAPADPASQERLDIDGRSFTVTAQADVTGARGLVHARHSLLEDASFDWGTPAVEISDYALAVRFRGDGGTTTVAFDFAHEQVVCVESGHAAKVAPKIAAGWKTFAQRHSPVKPGQ